MEDLSLNDYQQRTEATAKYPSDGGIVYLALKLNGEAGEVAEKLGKIIRDNDSVVTESHELEIAHELGDVLWYFSQLAARFGFTLQEIAEFNLEKLEDRLNRDTIHGSGDKR